MYWASRVPWTLSSATTRKNAGVAVFGLPPTLFVRAALVAEPVTAASFAAKNAGLVPAAAPDVAGPTTPTTWLSAMTFWAAVAATAGSSVESAATILNLSPSFAPMFLAARVAHEP